MYIYVIQEWNYNRDSLQGKSGERKEKPLYPDDIKSSSADGGWNFLKLKRDIIGSEDNLSDQDDQD